METRLNSLVVVWILEATENVIVHLEFLTLLPSLSLRLRKRRRRRRRRQRRVVRSTPKALVVLHHHWRTKQEKERNDKCERLRGKGSFCGGGFTWNRWLIFWTKNNETTSSLYMENADLREGFLKLHLILFNIILSTLLTIKKKKNSLSFSFCVWVCLVKRLSINRLLISVYIIPGVNNIKGEIIGCRRPHQPLPCLNW